jgi:hypothetical protein
MKAATQAATKAGSGTGWNSLSAFDPASIAPEVGVFRLPKYQHAALKRRTIATPSFDFGSSGAFRVSSPAGRKR